MHVPYIQLLICILLGSCSHLTPSKRLSIIEQIGLDSNQIDSIVNSTETICDYGQWYGLMGESEDVSPINIDFIKDYPSIFIYNKLYKKRKFNEIHRMSQSDLNEESTSDKKYRIYSLSDFPLKLKSAFIPSRDWLEMRYGAGWMNDSIISLHYPYKLENLDESTINELKGELIVNGVALNSEKLFRDKNIINLRIITAQVYQFKKEYYLSIYFNHPIYFHKVPEVLLFRILDTNLRLELIELPVPLNRMTAFPFEDFNDDGILDYAPIVGDSLVQLYSLHGKEFILNEKFKVSLNLSQNNMLYHINEKKTNWFGPNGGVFTPDWLKQN